MAQFKYERVLQNIRQSIISGTFAPGSAIPPEISLSRMFSVSRITIRRAVDTLVDEGLLVRRQGSGTYVSSSDASSVSETDSSNVIHVIFTLEISDSLLECINAISSYLSNLNFCVQIHNSQWSSAKERVLLKSLLEKPTRGLVFFPVSDTENMDLVCQISARRIPTVIIDKQYPETLGLPSVKSDNIAGGKMAAEHLISKGHRKIAFATFEPLSYSSTLAERYCGFLQAFYEHGLENPYKLIPKEKIFMENQSFTAGYYTNAQPQTNNFTAVLDKAVSKFHSAGVTGIVCSSDMLAINIFSACKRKGLKVPEDMSIVGYDNLLLLDQQNIPLTTIAQDFTQMGRQAAVLLYRQILSGNPISPAPTYLPVQLVERSSVRSL